MAKDMKDLKHESEATPFDAKQFAKDIDSLMAKGEDVASKNQALGGEFKRLEKDRGYHMKAVKMMVQLKKMSDENRDNFLAAFNDYCSALGFAPKETLFDKTGADKASKGRNGARLAEVVN